MKAKDIFKKVETYNKLVEELEPYGDRRYKAVLFRDCDRPMFKCETYREFCKKVNKNYIKAFAEMLKTYDDFRINKMCETQCIIWGEAHDVVVEFEIVDADNYSYLD